MTVPRPACWPCYVTTVGSRWIELTVIPAGCQSHLNSATGTAAVCSPWRYPAVYDGSIQQIVPGILTLLGSFALATGPDNNNLLERCHSSWHRRLNGLAIGGSKMVLWSNDEWVSTRVPVHGLWLGSLRAFNFFIPRSFRPHNALLNAIAVSGRTIYALTPGGALWAATVPSGA